MQGGHQEPTRHTRPGAGAGRLGCLFATFLLADVVLFLMAFRLITGGSSRAFGVLVLVLGAAGIVFSLPATLLIMQDGLGMGDILRGLGRSRGWQIVIGGVMGVLLAGLAVSALAGLWPMSTAAPQNASLTALPLTSPAVLSPTMSASPTQSAFVVPTSAPVTAVPSSSPTRPGTVPLAATATVAATAIPTPSAPATTPVPPTPTSPPTVISVQPALLSSPSPQPLPTMTATPRVEELVTMVVVDANEMLVAAMQNLAQPAEELRTYYCGISAWRKVTNFLARVAQMRGGAVTATYFVSDAQPPVQELDYRWRVEQEETWTYAARTGRSTREQRSYTYWLVERPGETPALCIDDYSSKQVP